MKSFTEQIRDLEEELTGKRQRIDEIKAKANGNLDALDENDLDELDQLGADEKEVAVKIRRLSTLENKSSSAVAVTAEIGRDPDRATRVRYGDFQEKSNLDKGMRWTMAVLAKAYAIKHSMSMSDAAMYAKHVWPDHPEIQKYLQLNPAMREKANAGTGLSGNWAEPLNVANTLENEFIDILYPATIIGNLGLRPAPFNVKMLRRTAGVSTANWVGNNEAKPVGENAWDTVSIPQSKIADIVVLTDDQINTSLIDNVAAVKSDLVEQISMFADEQFTDPSVAATANNPASILYGVDDVSSNGNAADDLRADLYALLNRFAAANIPLNKVTIIMSSFVASGISMLTNALGQAEFPEVTVEGGRLRGLKVVVSNNIGGSSTGSNLIGVAPSEIMLAQRGGITVDMSRDATIDMAGGNSPTYSLFQKNAMALRCEWWVAWAKRRAAAAQYVSGVAYAPQPAA